MADDGCNSGAVPLARRLFEPLDVAEIAPSDSGAVGFYAAFGDVQADAIEVYAAKKSSVF
jgi:hypothetical protein